MSKRSAPMQAMERSPAQENLMDQTSGLRSTGISLVSTNVGSLNIFWPQDSVLPVVTASTIQANFNALQSQVTQLQAMESLNTLLIGTIISWFSNATPPDGWVVCDGTTAGIPDLRHRFLGAHRETSVARGVKSPRVSTPVFTHPLVEPTG